MVWNETSGTFDPDSFPEDAIQSAACAAQRLSGTLVSLLLSAREDIDFVCYETLRCELNEFNCCLRELKRRRRDNPASYICAVRKLYPATGVQIGLIRKHCYAEIVVDLAESLRLRLGVNLLVIAFEGDEYTPVDPDEVIKTWHIKRTDFAERLSLEEIKQLEIAMRNEQLSVAEMFEHNAVQAATPNVAKPDDERAKWFEVLIEFSAQLKGIQQRVLVLLIEASGSMPIADVATDRLVGWQKPYKASVDGLRRELNGKLRPMNASLRVRNNCLEFVAKAAPKRAKKRAAKAQQK